MAHSRNETRTGGRPASSGVIPGDVALSVGRPDKLEPPGWKWTALSDVARLETGHTPSRKYPEYWGGDVPWIGIKDATENHGRTIADTIQHTNDLGIANSSARVLPAHTVCLSRTASVGYVVVMGRPMATSQDFVNWVCSEAIDYRFLKYVLLAENAAFLRFASGTTHQTIYFPEVKAFHVCLPPPDEQRAIAHILGTLDDKIELNRRMNETLEAMARALFKLWFVDFDPVRTKMNLPSPSGRGVGGEGTKPAPRANAPIPTRFLDFARQLRRQATDAENLLWCLLRGRRIANAKFRRQHPFPPYILDFYCHELKLAVELDGGQHNEEVGRRRDAQRDEYLAGHGIRVLRFWNNEVLGETEAVLEAIYAAVMERSGGVPSLPAPLPKGEGSCGQPLSFVDLFPDSFEDSNLGEIPRGWRPTYWGELVTLEYGKSLSGYNEQAGSYPVYGTNGRIGRYSAPLCKHPGVIVGRKGAYRGVHFCDEPFYVIDTAFYVEPRGGCVDLRWVYYELLRYDIHSMDSGLAIPSTSREDFYSIPVLCPPFEVQQTYASLASPFWARQKQNSEESRILAALRDTLLPKLISGELRISDAESLVARYT